MKKMTCRLRDDNTVLEITVKKSNPINQIFIDTYENKNSYKSNNSADHEFSFIIPNELVQTEITNTGYIKYYIPAASLELHKYCEMYIVTAVFGPNVNESQIVYNTQQLYCFRLNLINNLCIPCYDKKNLDSLQVLMFREIMFKEAVGLSRIDDAINFYGKILNIRGIVSNNQHARSACTSCGI